MQTTVRWLCLAALLSPLGAQTRLADVILADAARVPWNTPYQDHHSVPGETCQLVPPHTTLRHGIWDYAYHCMTTSDGVIAEAFYYPTDDDSPRIVLRRADFRLSATGPELSAQVEQLLQTRLASQHGAGTVPNNLFEIGAYRPDRGLSWDTGDLTLFLHHNRDAVTPSGIRTGVQLIAVRREVLDLRERQKKADEAIETASAMSGPALSRDLKRELGDLFVAPGEESQTRAALLKLLAAADGGTGNRRAAVLVGADELALRLGTLLVTRTGEAPNAEAVRRQLAPYGIHYGGIGHDSGVLEYNHGLLARAWKEFPDTAWGQRAFLLMQPLACAAGLPAPCPGQSCFRMVIHEGEAFLRDHPQTPFRREQIYNLALAYETWWSLSQAAPGDDTAEGANVDRAGGDIARRHALSLYEEVTRMAPGSPEALSASLRLPRLKLSLDTGERAFFCFWC
jgi:hypothetical protein